MTSVIGRAGASPPSRSAWQNFPYIYIYKCKNIFTKMLKDVGIEVPKSVETRSKYTMHAYKGRG